MYCYPDAFTDALIEMIRKEPKFVNILIYRFNTQIMKF
jgi:tRNA A37 methylthiotransferase MiaB